MSSREIAQIEQAINQRADALYQNWCVSGRVTPPLSPPSPQPDPTPPPPQTKWSSVDEWVANARQGGEEDPEEIDPDHSERMSRIEDTLHLLADPDLTPKLETLVSNFVRSDRAKRNNMVVRHHPINLTGNGANTPNSHSSTSPTLPDDLNSNGPKKGLPRSILAAVKRFDANPAKPTNGDNSGGAPRRRSPSPSSGSPRPKVTIIPVSVIKNENPQPWRSSPAPQTPMTSIGMPTPRSNGENRRERMIPIEREANSHSPLNGLERDYEDGGRRSPGKKEIRHRINLVDSHPHELNAEVSSLTHGRPSSPMFDRISSRESSSSPISYTGESPGIAFAKERIRHLQEHPLTQQRLELQRRLPSPSNKESSAIALQQGRVKFDPHDPGHVNSLNATAPAGGRHSWLKYGSGSVADRVQLFEKHPAQVHHHMHPSSTPSSAENTFIIPINTHRTSLGHQEVVSSSPTRSRTVVVGKDIFPMGHQMGPTPRKSNSNAPWRTQSHPNEKSHSHMTTPNSRTIIQQPRENHHQVQVIPTLKAYTKPSTQSAPPRRTAARFRRPPENVPKFYWREGGRLPTLSAVHEAVARAEVELSKYLHSQVKYPQFGSIISTLGLPLYWKRGLWSALGLTLEQSLDPKVFVNYYRKLIGSCPDESSQFMRILSESAHNFPISSSEIKNPPKPLQKPTRKQLEIPPPAELAMSDFVPIIQDIIDTHPGLGFLREAPEFHSRYVTTVISRIFYKVNRSWSGRISLPELRRSNLLRILRRLETETDINLITEYFSYEHFYVIYCRFWELDKDHDLLIDKRDLSAHADHALSSRIIDRIFSGTVIRGWDVGTPFRCPPGKMTYSDFVWFLISEEDKKSPTAIEYWFRCLDVDGDGILSPYELQYFYSEQASRIECLGVEPLDFANVYCQFVDMLRASPTGILLKDLKSNPTLAANMFNTLFNLDKYLDHEQRDPFATAAITGEGEGCGGEGETDWDKYASQEYELLIAEESPGGSGPICEEPL